MVITLLPAQPGTAERAVPDHGQEGTEVHAELRLLLRPADGVRAVRRSCRSSRSGTCCRSAASSSAGWPTTSASQMIFEPVDRTSGGCPGTRDCCSSGRTRSPSMYSRMVADKVITLQNIGNELLTGPRSDRTMQLLEDSLRPAVDRAVGPARAAVRMAIGSTEYDNIRSSVATEATGFAPIAFNDAEFSRQQSSKIYDFISDADEPDELARLHRDAPLGHQAGRVVTVLPRRRSGTVRRTAAPRDLRSLNRCMADNVVERRRRRRPKAVARRPRPVPTLNADGTVAQRRRPMPGPAVLRAAPGGGPRRGRVGVAPRELVASGPPSPAPTTWPGARSRASRRPRSCRRPPPTCARSRGGRWACRPPTRRRRASARRRTSPARHVRARPAAPRHRSDAPQQRRPRRRGHPPGVRAHPRRHHARTRPASCASSTSTARSRRSTSAPTARSASARNWSRAG